ncbi:Ig-like domain-containing protein [Brevundimonas sp.]
MTVHADAGAFLSSDGSAPQTNGPDEAPPHIYSFDFDQGMGAWSTWMAASVVQEAGGEHQAFTRLNAPGLLDPNHLDGIGALRLVAHLSIPAPGSPGVLNLTNAEFEITVRATDFDANGGKLVVWLCRYVPEEGVYKNFYVPLVGTNWANTGNDLTDQLVEGEWRTITVRLSDDPADWTYAGVNHTQQGDWADRYQPFDLDQTQAYTDGTLHLVFINDEPDEAPSGFLDIANITVRTHEPAIPLDTGAATRDVFHGLEDQAIIDVLPGDGTVDLANAIFSVVEGSVSNGTVSLDATTGAFVFTPDADYHGPTGFAGPAQFRYSVTDGTNTIERTAYFYIGGVNDRPTTTTEDESVRIASDTPFTSGLRIGADADVNERLTYRLVEGSASHGTVTIDPENGRYTFTPAAGFSGEATFSYVVSDGQLDSDSRTVTFTVLPPGQQPERLDYSQAVELLIAGDLQGFIRNVITLADTGDIGAMVFYGTWLRYGQYVPRDTELAAHYLEQVRGIAEVNLILADMYATGEGVTQNAAEARVLLQALPNDAQALYRLATLYDHGLGGPVDDVLAVETYLLAANLGNADAMYTVGRRYLMGEGVAVSAEDAYFWLGVGLRLGGGPALDVFDYQLIFNMQQAADLGLSVEQRATLDLAIAAWLPGQTPPVNDVPVAGEAPGPIDGGIDEVLTGILNPGSDADGDRLTFQLVPGSAENGVVTIDPATGAWTFTPAIGYAGTAIFRYVVSDGRAASAEQTVSLRFSGPTLAAADVGSIAEAASLTVGVGDGVLANDDVSLTGMTATVIGVNGQAGNVGQAVVGQYGTLILAADGSYVFVAAPATASLIQGETLTQTFTYTITDQDGVSSTASLTLTIRGTGGRELTGSGVVIGSALDDVLSGGNGSDVILGQGGDDVIRGGTGATDELYGGTGDDRFILEANDTIVEFANEGYDTVEARIGVYNLGANIEAMIYTGMGNFIGTGNGLDNALTGGGGDDVLRGRGGNDRLDGGAGTDTADYAQATSWVKVRLDLAWTMDDGEGGTDTLVSIENLTGSQFDDVMVGNAGNNVILGGLGADVLLGGDGDDIIMGGQIQANQVHGGRGDDWFILDAPDTVIEHAGEGIDTVESRVSTYTLAANVENMIYTGPASFSGWGNGLDNRITGGVANDYLRGMGGNDIIDGGAGIDTLYLRGLSADYTVTAEGEGWRVLDTVAGRDGSTFVTSIELLLFANGQVRVLEPGTNSAPAWSDGKGADEAQTLPGITADDYMDMKSTIDEPWVQPALDQGETVARSDFWLSLAPDVQGQGYRTLLADDLPILTLHPADSWG